MLTISEWFQLPRHVALIAPTTANSAIIVLTSQTGFKGCQKKLSQRFCERVRNQKERKKPMVRIEVVEKIAAPTMSITAKAS